MKSPKHLSAESRVFWDQINTDWNLEPSHLKVLQAALESWDRMSEARETLAVEGATYPDRFGAPRKHPSVSIEENARSAFLRAMAQLKLEDEKPREPRLNRKYRP